MKLYKLTDRNGKTYGGYQWGEGVTHGEDELLVGEDPLCPGHWYYAYQDPVLAILMNPAHANFKSPRLWEAEGTADKVSPDRVGCKSLTTLREIPLPDVTFIQKQAFGILAALRVYSNPEFVGWAIRWLSGADRSADAADWVAAWATARAAWAAAGAAWAVAGDAGWPAGAGWPAVWDAADAAVRAADAAEIDLVAIAHRAMEY